MMCGADIGNKKWKKEGIHDEVIVSCLTKKVGCCDYKYYSMKSRVCWFCPERAEWWWHWKVCTPLTCFVPLQSKVHPCFYWQYLVNFFVTSLMCVPEVSHILLNVKQGSVINQEAFAGPAAWPFSCPCGLRNAQNDLFYRQEVISPAQVVPITCIMG